MMYATKDRPVSVCSVCRSFGYSTQYIGQRCSKPDGGRRCTGVRMRATDPENWKRCPKCAGTGHYDTDECGLCLNRGWLYVRPKAELPVVG